MWPVAIFVMLVVLFYWLAFCLTVWAWFQSVIRRLDPEALAYFGPWHPWWWHPTHGCPK
jgi:hypothetical protein